MNTDDKRTETATFGGGCFWCMEAVFSRHEGVKSIVSGYAGGSTDKPSYEDVCTGTTGHAEVIQVTYDPDILGYEDLLDIFWRSHDPTTLNRQGADVGTQYRSIILYHNEDQRTAAERSRQALDDSGAYRDAIITDIQPLDAFYPAEEYHQDYFQKHPYAGYCTFVIRPKLKKLNLLH
ncbi:MAG: peptide-methionine (S)-S-oxide reductase MsrA [Sediminispirochaetaceae bacterium]